MPLLDLIINIGPTELFFISLFVGLTVLACILYTRRTNPPFTMESASSGYAWLRKSGPYLLLLAFVLIYPFTGPFVHFVTDLFLGVHNHPTDALGNVSDATVAADQIAGGGVQLGTFFTKFWLTIIFFLLAKGLPWLIQPLTHPGPTQWAKTKYTDDFNELPLVPKFEAYGRLQQVDAFKFIGAGIIAALLV